MRNLSLTGVPMRALNRSFRASARRTPAWLHGAAALTSLIALGGCSAPAGTLPADDDGVDVPEYRGPQPNGTLPPQAGNGTTPGATGSSTNGSTGTNNPPTSNVNEQTGANDTPLTPNTNNNSGNNNSGNQGAAGASMVPPPSGNQGAGGSSMVPPPAGNQGAGGSSMGGNDNPGDDGNTDPSTPPVEPPPVEPPPVEQPPVEQPIPVGPDTVCPANASFCAGFEGDGFPLGSQFDPSYLAADALGAQMQLDDTVANSGNQSLHLPVGANFYRMLSVPVPANDFWIRLYTRSDVGFGADGSVHASIFMGSIVEPGGDYNADRAVEIAEQHDQVLLNVKDALFGTSGTNPNGQPGTTLPDNAWVCMEARFDGNTGNINVYVEGDEIINAAGWQPPMTFRSFRFGYLRYSSPARDVWVDDVVVATSRIGCL